LWQHVLDFFVADEDLVDGVSSVLQGNVIAIDVGRKEDFWIRIMVRYGGKHLCDRQHVPGFQAKPWLEER
jgi:hypothetical protein